jgi:hypothetical protein
MEGLDYTREFPQVAFALKNLKRRIEGGPFKPDSGFRSLDFARDFGSGL